MRGAAPCYRPGRRTRYEVVAHRPGMDPVVVGFTARTSRHGLLALLRSRGEEIIEHFGIDEDAQVRFLTRPRVHAAFDGAGGLIIGFTGRTELEAHHTAEVPTDRFPVARPAATT